MVRKGNYIEQLEKAIAELAESVEAAEQWVNDFRMHLNLPKFRTQDRGERRDWIATNDVMDRLSNLSRELANLSTTSENVVERVLEKTGLPGSTSGTNYSDSFEEAKAEQAELEAQVKELGSILRSMSGGDSMGLTPDYIKKSPEWREAKAAYNEAFRELQSFNKWFTKTFKSEIRADRRKRDQQRNRRRSTGAVVEDVDRPDRGGTPPKMQAVRDEIADALEDLDIPVLQVTTDDNIMSSVSIVGSLEPREQWINGILQNSPYFKMSVAPSSGRYYSEGDKMSVELIASGMGMPKFRKYSTDKVDRIAKKIRDYLTKATDEVV